MQRFFGWTKWAVIAAALGMGTSLTQDAAAGPVSAAGLTFTEVTPGFSLDSLAGNGTAATPFLLGETINAGGLDTTFKVEGMPTYTAGNNGGNVGIHLKGFLITKTVTNNSGVDWTSFDMELQEILGVASGEGDGLSFAQGTAEVRPFTSDKFAFVDEVIDVRDYINFSAGLVKPGETVTFNFAITDNSPISPFYVRERPNFAVPEPATITIACFGLAGFAGYALRKRRKLQVLA